MPYKRHTGILLFTTLIVLALLFGLNIVVDPYNVLGTGQLKYSFQPNERYLKIAYLERNAGQYDSFLLGSSRIGTTHPSMVQKYLPGSHFYNLSVAIGTPYDYLQQLNFFLAKGIRPKNLYLELDADLGLTEFSHYSEYLLTKPHPAVTERNPILYWLEFASAFQPQALREKLWKNLISSVPEKFLLLDMAAGTWSRPLQNAGIAADPERYIREEASFHQRNSRIVKNIRGRDNLRALREIRDICAHHKIRLIVFTTPHHRSIMDSLVEKDYLDWLRDLAAITPFWDFGAYNSITLDDHNYLESSHYLPHVGKLIAARIFNDPDTPVPADFGVRVDSDNVEQHLSELGKQIKVYDAKRTMPAKPVRAKNNKS